MGGRAGGGGGGEEEKDKKEGERRRREREGLRGREGGNVILNLHLMVCNDFINCKQTSRY